MAVERESLEAVLDGKQTLHQAGNQLPGSYGSMRGLWHINGRVTKARPGQDSRCFGVLNAMIGDGKEKRCVTAETAQPMVKNISAQGILPKQPKGLMPVRSCPSSTNCTFSSTSIHIDHSPSESGLHSS